MLSLEETANANDDAWSVFTTFTRGGRFRKGAAKLLMLPFRCRDRYEESQL